MIPSSYASQLRQYGNVFLTKAAGVGHMHMGTGSHQAVLKSSVAVFLMPVPLLETKLQSAVSTQLLPVVGAVKQEHVLQPVMPAQHGHRLGA